MPIAWRSRIDRWVLVDCLVAVVALSTELPFYLWQGPVVVAGEVVLALVIAARRLVPFVAAVAYGVAFTTQAIVNPDSPEEQLCLIGAVALSYTFGTLRRWPPSVAGLALVMLGAGAHEVWGGGDYTFVLGLTIVGWLPGVAVRYRNQEVRRLHSEAAAQQREQVLREAAAVGAERNRLARELHDVVSHSVSAMVVQAAAAEQVLQQDPVSAAGALDRVQQTGRAAIAELHQLLGVLRPDAEPGFAMTLGLGAVADLIHEAQAAGQDVHLEMPVDLPALPAALHLSAYRIVQESLTNARKYAPRASVTVRVTVDANEVAVEVTDAGGGAPVGCGGGRGLRGLQERAAAIGGTLVAGPAGPGFRVHARLPVTAG